MMDKIAHRGPDQAGTYIDDEVALGFRRLSIIDLDHGSQPMFNETGDIAIVFNGEIYNHKELREELIQDLGSADELKRILADYQAYNELIDAGTATSEALEEYQMQLDYIRELLNSSKNKDYIVKIARDELNLYFADEEIIYNDIK
jgi:hypothetical protein